jgi:branched-subunit amino acid transport protein AzlD
VQTVQRVAAAAFGVVLAALIPFWAIKGTKPAGDAALTILYGLLAASALSWLAATCYRWVTKRHRSDDAATVNVYTETSTFINVTIVIQQTKPADTPTGAPQPSRVDTPVSDQE